MFKVTNQSRYRPRVGRVIGPALGGAAGSSSSRKRRKTGARVPAKKNQRSSFCLPHLDQGYLREANLLARRYKIRVRSARVTLIFKLKLTFSGCRNWGLWIPIRSYLSWTWIKLWSTLVTRVWLSLCALTSTCSCKGPTKSLIWWSGQPRTWLASRAPWKGWASASTKTLSN